MKNQSPSQRASALINRAAKEEEAAIDSGNIEKFFFYHAIALKLIGFRIKLMEQSRLFDFTPKNVEVI